MELQHMIVDCAGRAYDGTAQMLQAAILTFESSSDGALTVSVHATLKLNSGDQIPIVIFTGQVFDSTSYGTQFTGSLLEDDLVIP